MNNNFFKLSMHVILSTYVVRKTIKDSVKKIHNYIQLHENVVILIYFFLSFFQIGLIRKRKQ